MNNSYISLIKEKQLPKWDISPVTKHKPRRYIKCPKLPRISQPEALLHTLSRTQPWHVWLNHVLPPAWHTADILLQYQFNLHGKDNF